MCFEEDEWHDLFINTYVYILLFSLVFSFTPTVLQFICLFILVLIYPLAFAVVVFHSVELMQCDCYYCASKYCKIWTGLNFCFELDLVMGVLLPDEELITICMYCFWKLIHVIIYMYLVFWCVTLKYLSDLKLFFFFFFLHSTVVSVLQRGMRMKKKIN
ncbi:hypothetical protein EGW08_008754 [Elysia chlorotica]|uniref:Uncharacterized protein n=1 Tax=Elysia chlorotica TaxID=188477 RepID=A0A433TPK8_ELYCH|nr:hypothetical protein EGW08_008754 [Elysia chlorotica]